MLIIEQAWLDCRIHEPQNWPKDSNIEGSNGLQQYKQRPEPSQLGVEQKAVLFGACPS